MRFLVLCLFVTALMVSPVYLLDAFVMPQINSLQNTYAHAGEIADHIAEGAGSTTDSQK